MEVTSPTTLRLRFSRPYQSYRKGQEITLPKGVARSMVLSGIATEVREEPMLEFAVAPEPETEQAITSIAKAARRRKKK
jgi:hypothetical protein